MQLLDLPPELYERIITHLVRSAPIEKIWKLRVTCHHFDGEIIRRALTILLPEAFQSPPASRILSKNLGYYLAIRVPTTDNIRPNIPSDVRQDLPRKIARMAEYLYKELNANTEGTKWNVLLRLCKGLASTMLPDSPSSKWPDLRNYLWGVSLIPSCIKRDFGTDDQLVAHVAIGDASRAMRILLKVSIKDESRIYGKHLTNAVIISDIQLLLALIDYFRHHPWTSQAGRQSLVLGNSHLGARDPIHKAIEQGKAAFLQKLLEYLFTQVQQPGSNVIDDFLSRTLSIDGAECLDVILDCSQKFVLKDQKRITNGLFMRACRLKAYSCIPVIIHKGGLRLDSMLPSSSPMCMAIRTNCGGTVQAVIAAGANVNFRVKIEGGNNRQTLLEYAIISQNFNVVKTLIRAGAELPPLPTWPLHYTTYMALRKVKIDREGSKYPSSSRSRS